MKKAPFSIFGGEVMKKEPFGIIVEVRTREEYDRLLELVVKAGCVDLLEKRAAKDAERFISERGKK